MLAAGATAYGHEAGRPLECLSIAVELRKESAVDEQGQPVLRVGFKIGGGIDQDPSRAPFVYPDTVCLSGWSILQGIYITHIDEDSPAQRAGLRQHDKILRVNGNDFTMVTHDKAVKYIKSYPVLHILVARRPLPSR